MITRFEINERIADLLIRELRHHLGSAYTDSGRLDISNRAYLTLIKWYISDEPDRFGMPIRDACIDLIVFNARRHKEFKMSLTDGKWKCVH